ncbi:MIP/aquaporin family protein [Bifidobacterium aquikefiricola]|uniref:MIP/aquaporin family protein n=1 Tax=Bifidobacterium aquikefiricola TaxID=3059038 RepID=A0AB39U6P0_9BIFI
MSEFLGTMVMIFTGVMVSIAVALRKADQAVGALGWACAVFAGASIGDHSGAHLNPAITLAQVLTGGIVWKQVPFYLCGQFFGACAGAAFAAMVFWTELRERREQKDLVGWFATVSRVSYVQAVVIEALCTTVLVAWILDSPRSYVAGGVFNFGNSGLGYLGVALIVFMLCLAAGGQTGAALNPVRDLGPRIIYSLLFRTRGYPTAGWKYAWVPVVGPLIGAMGGVGMSYVLQSSI